MADFIDLYHAIANKLPLVFYDGLDLSVTYGLEFTDVAFSKAVKGLPEGLVVQGDLNLRNTACYQLPDRIDVSGNIITPMGTRCENVDAARVRLALEAAEAD